jgi:hypothetical protein
MVTPPPRTQVYLFRSAGISGGLSNFSIALLELTDSTVRCTITGDAGYAGWIAKRLAIPDLHKRLKAGEHVTVFEFPRNGYRITWPTIAGGELFKISQGNGPEWVVRFTPLRGQGDDVVVDGSLAGESGVAGVLGEAFLAADAMSVVGVLRTGDVRKQWRQALDPTGQQVPSSYQPPDVTPAAPQPPSTLPPPGWYPDPAGAPGTWRYWDGARWNPTTQPPSPSQP